MEGKEYEFDFFKQFNLEKVDDIYVFPFSSTFDQENNFNVNNFLSIDYNFSNFDNNKTDGVQLIQKLNKVDNIIHNNIISSPTTSIILY